MSHPKLRIAWSVIWGVVAVLVCVLWVRSYWWVTNIQVPNSFGRDNQIVLAQGTIHFSSHPKDEEGMSALTSNYHSSSTSYKYFSGHPEYRQFLLSVNNVDRTAIWLIVPYWFAAIMAVSAGSVAWLPFRFSLRTLLIATTLVAVGLGTIIWMAK